MSEGIARTLPPLDANSATALLDKAAQATPTNWSPGPGFNLFYARMVAARQPVERPIFESRPLL